MSRKHIKLLNKEAKRRKHGMSSVKTFTLSRERYQESIVEC